MVPPRRLFCMGGLGGATANMLLLIPEPLQLLLHVLPGRRAHVKVHRRRCAAQAQVNAGNPYL